MWFEARFGSGESHSRYFDRRVHLMGKKARSAGVALGMVHMEVNGRTGLVSVAVQNYNEEGVISTWWGLLP